MIADTPAALWLNGRIVPWAEGVVHVRSDAFMRGASVFEGIRVYLGEEGEAFIFRLEGHLDRLFDCSMKILRLETDWDKLAVQAGMVDLLRAIECHDDTHVRVQVYFGCGEDYAYERAKIETGCVISTSRRSNSASFTAGVSTCVSTCRRISDEDLPPRVKAAGNYLNSRYAMMEARVRGYRSAILLNRDGQVAEGPGACIMMVRGGKVCTPPVTAGILESITRATLIELLEQEMNLSVIERAIERTELYIADELFFCGTGQEVVPIVSVDDYEVGRGVRGPITERLQGIYFDVVRGQSPRYRGWLTPVFH